MEDLIKAAKMSSVSAVCCCSFLYEKTFITVMCSDIFRRYTHTHLSTYFSFSLDGQSNHVMPSTQRYQQTTYSQIFPRLNQSYILDCCADASHRLIMASVAWLVRLQSDDEVCFSCAANSGAAFANICGRYLGIKQFTRAKINSGKSCKPDFFFIVFLQMFNTAFGYLPLASVWLCSYPGSSQNP